MPDQGAPAGPPAPIFNLDVSGLTNGIWSAMLAHLNEIGAAMWTALSQWLYSLLRSLFIGLWNATLLPIPHDATDQFDPVHAIFQASGTIAAAGVILAVVLLGVRTLTSGITGQGRLLDELLGRLAVYACGLSLLPWVISHAIDLQRSIAASVAMVSINAILPDSSGNNPIALLLVLVLGLRLWLKTAANVVHVAVAIAWSPVALMCGLIPETSWVASLWTREFVGRLAGAVLATVASGIGLALALANAGGGSENFVVFGAAGAFLAAHDLVDWLAKTPGSSMGGLVGAGMRLGVGLASGGGGTVAAAAPIARNQMATMADMYGVD